MHGNCSIAMLLSQLLAGLIVVIATILGFDGSGTLGSVADDNIKYPWRKQISTHKTPYKVSEDI